MAREVFFIYLFMLSLLVGRDCGGSSLLFCRRIMKGIEEFGSHGGEQCFPVSSFLWFSLSN